MTFPYMPGECRFCGITDAEIDGDRFRWLNNRRDCCANPACVAARERKAKEARETQARMNRKRTPAEIEDLKRQERAARRRRRSLKGAV
jgi:hypothetical protein